VNLNVHFYILLQGGDYFVGNTFKQIYAAIKM